MKFLIIAILSHASATAFATGDANPPTQPPPSLKCSGNDADQIAEKSIRATATSIPNATGFVTSVQISGTKDSQGYASVADFSYALVDKDGRIVGLGMETLNGECQDQGGSFTGSISGTLPVKPLH